MLRWCRPSFHVSRGYGASRTHLTRSQDASQFGLLLGPNISKHEISSRTYSAQSVAVARDAPDERNSTRHPNSFLYQYNTELSQIIPLRFAWTPSVLDTSPNLPRPTSSKQLIHSPNSIHLQTSPTNRRPSITSRNVGHNSRKIATSQSSHRQFSDANIGATLSRHLQRSRLRGTAFSEAMIDEMVHLYSSCQSRKLLYELSARDSETLLTICGRYSAPALQWSQLPHEVRVTSKPGRSGKVYWRFIMEVVKDRESVSGGLTKVERFWRLNGLLHLLSNGIRSEASMAGIIRQVNEDYLALRRSIPEESFYLAYFRTMLAIGPKLQSVQVLDHLCDYLEGFNHPSHSLLELFWGALLTGRLDGVPSLQARVLNLVNARLSAAIPKTSLSPQPDNPGPADGGREVLTVHALSRYFTSAIFTCYRAGQAPNFLLRWTFKETRKAFAPTQPHDLRWAGLLLLAKNMMESNRFRPIPSPQNTPTTIRWQTILFLSGVETTLERLDPADLSTLEAKSYLKTVSNTLWKNWLQAEYLQCPIDVKRTAISSFFKIAAAGGHESLLTECSRYCTKHKLLCWSPDGSLAMRRQALALAATYVYSLGECRQLSVPQVFEHVTALFPDRTSVNDVVSLLLPLFLTHDPNRAHEVLLFARINGIEVSPEAVVSLVIALAHDQQWDATVSILRDSRLSVKQRETILIAILRIFQTSRYQALDRTLAENLGLSLFQLYSTTDPSAVAKYPVRYFLGLLIAADHGRLAVDILERLFLTTPSFFTQRLIRQWVVQLVQKGLPSQASRLFKLSRHHFTLPQSIDLQRKLTAALFTANALGRAKKIVRDPVPSRTCPTRRERILRITVSRPVARDRRHTFRVMGSITRDRCPSPSTIETTVAILVRQGRLYAARKLFFQHNARLDTKISTVIGNTILHGYVFFRGSNTPRAIRHIFHMRDVLSESTKFTGDRTTFNILVKAILGSKKRMIDSGGVRALFDHIVRLGYPASERWRRENGVPFSTDAATACLPPWADQLPPVDQPISFVKHVQPLYKMFIKAFYLDEDRSAAKCVIGILKEERMLDRERMEARSRSIRDGVIRKKARERGGFLEGDLVDSDVR